jgi:5-methylcytosine-specific restriction protein A
MPLKAQLHQEMLNLYQYTGKATGYWAKRFLQSLQKKGGLETAKAILSPKRNIKNLKGLEALVKAKRADLSVEVLIANGKFSSLFTPDELYEAKKRIANFPKDAFPQKLSPEEIFPEINSLPIEEGGRKVIFVNAYERSAKARKICLAYWGTACVVCSISFEKVYGDIGKDFIHVHHLNPLAMIKKRKTIDPKKDLRPVCPNCHTMLHANNSLLGIDELKDRMKEVNKRNKCFNN